MGRMKKEDFARDSKAVAKDLIGRTLVRRLDNELYPLEIIETGAYFGEARRAKEGLKYGPGIIYIHSAQKTYKIFAIGTEKKDVASVVTIRQARSLRPLPPDKYRVLIDGPGKLTQRLKIGKEFDGLPIDGDNLWIEGDRVEDSLITFISPSEAKMSANCLGYYRMKF